MLMDLLREIDKLLTEAQRQSDDLNDQRDHGRVDGLEEARELAVAYIKHRQEANARVRELEDENQRMRERLRAVSLIKAWTNEDGKGFVFTDDLLVALGHITPDALSRAREIAEEKA